MREEEDELYANLRFWGEEGKGIYLKVRHHLSSCLVYEQDGT
jgi:hypothetical protein